jgi:hypothetical protein
LTPLPPRDVSESVLFETLRQACLNSCLITPFSKGLSLFETPKNIARAAIDHIKGVAILSVFHDKSQYCHSGIYLFGGLCKEPQLPLVLNLKAQLERSRMRSKVSRTVLKPSLGGDSQA